MAIVVRPADLDADRELLIDVLARHLTPLSDSRRFDWLYRESPQGQARAWIATEGDTGPIVGAAACFPRRMFVEGVATPVCVLGDFCIHPSCRSLGPALQLQRACLQDVDSGVFALAYDFPSTSMAAVYRRLGIDRRAEMIRLAKPIRVDRKVGEKVKSRSVARALSWTGNQILEWRDRAIPRKNGLQITPQNGACGEEFSALARQVSGRYGACVERSAEYLNWRYRAHPFRRYEFLVARREGALLGYVVFSQQGEDVGIADLFGQVEEGMLSSLVAGVVAIVRERRAITLSAPVLSSHPWRVLLENLGFRARESQPVMVYCPRQPAVQGRHAGPNWFLMDGDRES